MKYGVTLPLSGVEGDVGRLVEFAHSAEEEGWDGVFLEDYMVYWGPEAVPATFDPWVTMAAVAMRTRRVKLGITVTPLSRRRPWKVAREVVTLDHLSHGRLILGFGLGDVNEKGFSSFGEVLDARQRASMLDEGLEIVVGLMGGEPFSHHGEHYHVEEVTFLPRPVQMPRIPIWIGGFWPRTAPALRAARWDGFCAAKVPDASGNGSMTSADIRAVKAFMDQHRTSMDGFDITTGGQTFGLDRGWARAHVEELAEAGATWWSEFALPEKPGEAEMILARIKQGPPR